MSDDFEDQNENEQLDLSADLAELDNINQADDLNEDMLDVDAPEEEVQAAKKHGHLSKDEYLKKYGNLNGYKSPQEFNKFGKEWTEVKDVINGLKSQIEERNKAIDALAKYNERTEERAFLKAREQLETQLIQAKRLGNIDAVAELSKEAAKMDFHTAQAAQKNSEEERIRVTNDFRARNKHWLDNQQMVSRAQQIDEEERQKAELNKIPLTYQQLANLVEARLRIEFPDVMLNPNAGNNAPSLSSNQSASNVGSPVDTYDKVFNKLDSDHIAVFKATNQMLTRQNRKPYSKKEFIEKLRKEGEI